MQAWVCERTDGVDSLQWQSLPTPQPGPGEALIEVRAASLNFPDLLTVQGKYQFKPPLPFVPGSEFAGVVQAVGDGVSNVRVGDRVAALGSSGGFGTHACAPANRLMPLPEAMPFEHGAAFAFTYGTSHHALVDRAALKAGETVLVLGAAGGVGSAAVQIAKACGARVIGAVGSAAKADFVRGLGADEVLDYGRDSLRDALKALTQGQGVDVVYDPVGGALTEAAFRSLAWRGRHLVVGFADGAIPALPINLALLKGASLVGVFWGDFARREPKAYLHGLAQLLQWYGQGLVRPAIEPVLPLARLHEAYARMSGRQVLGKVVLVP